MIEQNKNDSAMKRKYVSILKHCHLHQSNTIKTSKAETHKTQKTNQNGNGLQLVINESVERCPGKKKK